MLIFVGGQKGGPGKSTVATNLAAMRKLEGKDVHLMDLDEQKTSTLWASLRDESGIDPRIPSTQKILGDNVINPGLIIRNEMKSLKPKHDDLIADGGGIADQAMKAALSLVDVAVFPIMPTAFDAWTLRKLNNIVSEVKELNPKLVAKVFFNKIPTHPAAAQNAIEKCDSILAKLESLERFKSTMVLRSVVDKSQWEGKAIIEYTPTDEKACEEIRGLYREVFYGS